MKAFYFAVEDRLLRYGDDRKVEVGAIHTVEGTPELCKHGLHASTKLLDAVDYAPGHHLYLVELGGEMDVGINKVCAQTREYLSYFNAEQLLREFARKQALINIEKIRPYCSEEDFQVIMSYLTTGAARSAAEIAARGAAESATWSAARRAAESAAWSAARRAANDMLTDMIREVTGWDI